MRTRPVFSVATFACMLLSLNIAYPQPDRPVINSRTSKEVAQTYGFYLGQSYSLDHIASAFPRLAPQVAAARMRFDAAFKSSIDNMDAMFSKQGPEWRHVKSDLRKRLKSTLDFSGITRQQAEEFIQTVGGRARGDIPSPILETLLLFNPTYLKSPVLELSDGFRSRYSSDGSAKAKGVAFHIDYPRSWSSEEANRPNIVRKFISENGRGIEMVMLSVLGLPSNTPMTESDIRAMSSPSALRETIPPNSTFLGGGSIRIDGRPGFFQKYELTSQQVDISVRTRAMSYTVFIGNKMLQIQCQVSAPHDQARSLDQRFQSFEPLFRQLANSLVIQSQWR